MKFLLDENISPKTAEFLRSLGVDAVHVIEAGLKGKSDEELYDFCRRNKYVMTTFDHEFAFEYLSKKDLLGLIVIRIHPQTADKVHRTLKDFFSKMKNGELEVVGNLIVIDKGRIRIRKVA